jgi:hypothetical protein
MRLCRLPRSLGSTSTARGKIAGSRQNRMPRDECGAFISSAFPYDAKNNVYLCPAGQQLVHKAVLDRGHGLRTHVYKAPRAACASCVYRTQCVSKKPTPQWRRGTEIYRQCSQIDEFPHAWIKERCGLRQFRCRGQEKTGMEAKWACLRSGYLAYAARLLTQLSLLHKKNQWSRYGRRS